MNKIAALVPIKTNSRRLPNKNFLKLGQLPLCTHIFNTLQNLENVDVYCYTSNISVMSLLPKTTRYLPREKKYDLDSVNVQELFFNAIKKLEEYETILITHATSPLLKYESLQEAIKIYLDKNNKYDSVVACRKFKKYCWFKNKPLNYVLSDSTQTNNLDTVYIETSGFYIFKRNYYLETNCRIGLNPFFYNVSYEESIDIDEKEDFNEASKLLSLRTFDKLLSENTEFDSPKVSGKIIDTKSIIDLIIFDLDGVLIDSAKLMKKAWDETCLIFSLDIDFSEFIKYIGKKFDEILNDLKIDHSIARKFSDTYFSKCAENIDFIEPFENVHLCLKELSKKFKISINTSKPQKNTTLILKKFFSDIDFDLVCCPELIPSNRGKPAPDSLLYICSNIGVDPKNAIYVGDMDVDSECAQRASINYIHAGWGYGKPHEINAIWFETIMDLKTYFLN